MINFYGKVLPILQKCMRISTIIIGIQISCSSLLMATGTNAQEMNLNVDKASVKQVFKSIERQANITFVYDDQVIKELPPVTLHIKDMSLAEVIKELQNTTQLKYKMVGNYIGVAANLQDIPRLSADEVTNNNTIKIEGFVRDATGQAIIGASVIVKGTTKGAQTNANGQFTIDANIGDVLVFTYLGYVKKEITVTGSSLTVELDEDSKQLGEVVVTALGIKKERKALGYSVTEIKGDELTTARQVNFASDLEGKVAGLNVTTISGGPASSVNINIRGSS